MASRASDCRKTTQDNAFSPSHVASPYGNSAHSVKYTNDRGDTFYCYTHGNCKCKPSSPPLNSPGDHEEVLDDWFTTLSLTDDGHGTRSTSNAQWEAQNMPIDRGHLRSYAHKTDDAASVTRSKAADEPIHGNHPVSNKDWVAEGVFSDEHSALVALHSAYRALELPITAEADDEAQHHMVQLAMTFAFRTSIRCSEVCADIKALGDGYDQCVLAVQFYHAYGAAVWGNTTDDKKLGNGRVATLESLFEVLQKLNYTSERVEEVEEESLKELVSLRRAAWRAAHGAAVKFDRSSSLKQLYYAMETQSSDNWIVTSFQHAAAAMTFDALDRVCDQPIEFFPYSRQPSKGLVNRVVQRLFNRYARKLWPNSVDKPENAAEILYYYILALTKSHLPRLEVGTTAVQILDGFLGLEDGDAEEAINREDDSSDDDHVFECPLAHQAVEKGCSKLFLSATEVIDHLIEVHEFERDLAEDLVRECVDI